MANEGFGHLTCQSVSRSICCELPMVCFCYEPIRRKVAKYRY